MGRFKQTKGKTTTAVVSRSSSSRSGSGSSSTTMNPNGFQGTPPPTSAADEAMS